MTKITLIIMLLAWNLNAFAQVKVFRANTFKSKVFSSQYKLPSQAVRNKRKVNWGLVNQQVLSFLNSSEGAQLTLLGDNKKELSLRTRRIDHTGITLRYIQSHNRVKIEGAELILIFDKSHKLRSVNNSLVNLSGFDTNVKFKKKSAMSKIVRTFKYKNPAMGRSVNDGLLITTYPASKKPVLVWQFSVREKGGFNKALSIQVIAGGSNAGKVLRFRNLKHRMTDVDIYDGQDIDGEVKPGAGVKVIEDSKVVNGTLRELSENIQNSFNNINIVSNFYSKVYSWESFDNKNSKISAITELKTGGLKENAAWVDGWGVFLFGFGGDILANIPGALDVVGHEFTHAVISRTSNLTYEKQSGALNEHFADVFGEMIEAASNKTGGKLLIGEHAMGPKANKEALRDMLHPERGLAKQPAHVNEIPKKFGEDCKPARSNDQCGVHSLSGIPNRAVALMVEVLGWKKLTQPLFKVMSVRLTANSNFGDYKTQLLDECSMSMDKSDCEVIERSFQTVGI